MTFKDFVISCPHCFCHSFYHYGKDDYGRQKYICRKCYHPFTGKLNEIKTSDKGYPNALFVAEIFLPSTNTTVLFILSVILICGKCYHSFTGKPNKIKTSDKGYPNALFVAEIFLPGTNRLFYSF